MNDHPLTHRSVDRHWSALKIAGLYLLAGGLWILFSDQLAAAVASGPAMLTRLSMLKGWGYIVVTALLLYWLIRRHTAALRKGEEQLRQVTDAMPALISYVDSDQHYRFNNRAYEEWFGHSRAEVQGKHLEQVLGTAAYQAISRHVEAALNGQLVTYEAEVPYKDGGMRFIQAAYIPDIGADRQVRGFFALVNDITERKQAEEALRESEQRLRAIIDNANGIVWIKDLDGRFLIVNRYHEGILGRPQEQVVGRTVFDLWPPDLAEEYADNDRQVLESGEPVEFEEAALLGDGRHTYASVKFPLRDSNGRIYALGAICTDITQHKRAEEALHRYELLASHSRDIILFMRHSDGQILEANTAATQAYGYSREELLGLSIHHLRAPETQALTADQMAEADARGILFETVHRRKDGSTFPVEVSLQGATIGGTYTLISMVRDITERKQAEAEVQMLARFPAENPNPVLRTTKDGLLIYANPASAGLLECWNCSVGRRLPAMWCKVILDTLDSGLLKEEEATCAERVFSVVVAPIVEGGYVNIYGRDVTERKRAEEALRESEARLNRSQEIAHLGSWELDLVKNQLTWSDEVYRIFGLQPQEFGATYEAFLEQTHPDDRAAVDAAYSVSLREGKSSYEIQHRVVRQATGEIRWVHEKCQHVTDTTGKIIRSLGMVLDITERKQAEEALRESEERYRQLFEAESDAIVLIDNETGRILEANNAASILYGYSREELLARRNVDLSAEPEDTRQVTQTTPVIADQVIMIPLRYHRKRDGAVFPVEITGRFFLRQGRPVHIAAIRDITERKQAEEEIRQLNAELEQRVVERTAQLEAANKELEAFAYSVSHDLRAPLRAIDGYTRILQEDYAPSLDAEAQRVCGVVRNQTRRMGQLIDDLLAFSRLGRAHMRAASIDMERLAVSVFDELAASEDRERLEYQVAPLPAAVGDPALIRQVWLNLLGNALKFSSKRERAVIEVGGRREAGENIYWVRDNGAGFDMRYADKLFGVFQRLHGEREFIGTGVGLAIVQRVIHRHGGRVWAQGEADQGATFYFTLPHKGD
jgi:PAS domain S-box-containing protein